MILPSNTRWRRYRTNNGICINEKCEKVLETYVRKNYEGKVQLVFTSPPFPLNRAKKYGNLEGEEYKAWLCSVGHQLKSLMAPLGSIVIDISGMRAMHIFLLFKYLKFIKCTQIAVINTIPYDYIFDNEPFVSYSSYVGDLSLNEIIGYGGKGEISQDCDLYIFMGFEGALSLKVAEDIAFSNLYLVNTIPSYYQKHKDISLVNNYSILQRKKNKLMHVPADNPFEVYNMLDSIADKNKMICIAPLSTKPISLGICLYALTNENVRIVYLVSKEYNNARSHDIYISYVYEIIL